MRLLVSACLLGVACRYDGQSKPLPAVLALGEDHQLIPVCGELFGGLPTPRPPAECREGQVRTAGGDDVTAAYRRGAAQVLELAQRLGCRAAVLKERSPSCGSGQIYDGSFSHRLTAGDGVTAALLKAHGIAVFGESQLTALAEWIKQEEAR